MHLLSKLFNKREFKPEITTIQNDTTSIMETSKDISTNQKDEFVGSLTGIFSVSPTAKVRFSKGNLQYLALNNSWHFAEHQYEIIGEANSLIAPSNNRYIDLFCWGASGFNNLFPYIGDIGDPFLYDCGRKDIASTRYDWGINNPIDNGGNKSGLWRTLTKDEWVYLLNGRDNACNLHAFGKIKNVCGLILMPDNYLNKDIIIEPNDFDSNILTEDQWCLVEKKGLVFLPCAGHRGSGTQLYHINISGCYWSTSFANSAMAYCFCVENKYINAVAEDFRESGLSVRLVTNI